MLHTDNKKLHPMEAAAVLAIIIFIVSSGIIGLGLAPHLPLTAGIVLLLLYGLLKKVPIADLEKGLIEGAASGLGAIYLFFFIGMLISSWMASGTIPTLMYYGFEFFAEVPLYLAVFVVCSIVGICIGSAFTTAATIGVAFVGMAAAMDASLAITAGAVVSGAFLGDKMSPLSETTNLASSAFDVPLFVHIKHMMWTTVPGFIISGFVFYFLSPGTGSVTADTESFLSALASDSIVHPAAFIPFIIVMVLAVKRLSAIMALTAGIISAVILAFIFDSSMSFAVMADILYSGFMADSKSDLVNAILSRGGIESMMSSVTLVLLALGMGGLLFLLGIIPSLLKAVERFLKTALSAIGAAAATAVGINFLIGEQYLSILLTGNTYRPVFDRLGLDRKTLSRTLEDTGTVINPLVPWGISGVFMTGVLGVTTVEYAPFAIFCLACPLLTILSAATNLGVSKKKDIGTSVD